MRYNTMAPMNPEKGAMSDAGSRDFYQLSRTLFSPVYPLIADQILSETGICSGKGLDIGCGPGDLAIEIARRSDLNMYACDISGEMFRIASENICGASMNERVIPVLGDVHTLDFSDSCMDLIVSRGSWIFWNDLPVAFREIFRVLKPEGIAYIGGGFGNAALRDDISMQLRARDPEWEKENIKRQSRNDSAILTPILSGVGCRDFRFRSDDTGFWMIIHKT